MFKGMARRDLIRCSDERGFVGVIKSSTNGRSDLHVWRAASLHTGRELYNAYLELYNRSEQSHYVGVDRPTALSGG